MAAGLTLFILSAADARGGTVTGQVIGAPEPPEARHQGYGKYRREAGAPGKIPHPLIVILEPKTRGALPKPSPEPAVMDQRNEQFQPRALPVMVGGTVDFLNSDSFYHNVFSLSSPRKFDLGRYRKGSSRPVTFTKPGLVKLFCEIHPQMIGYVLVTETPWFDSAAASGEFRIKDVPPGDYIVRVWHEGLSEPALLRPLQVGTETIHIDLDIENSSGP
jgi:plastocyanin